MENAKREKQNIGKRLDAFFDKNYAFFFAPIIVAILYMFALWKYEVYPFGDKYTAASYDLSAQICPFIEHLFDVFDGKSKLTFSYAIVGGADVGAFAVAADEAEKLDRAGAGGAEPVRGAGVELGRLPGVQGEVPVAEHQT